MEGTTQETTGFLDTLGDAARARFERSLRDVRVPEGGTVFDEGGPPDAMYVVRSGLVDLVATGPAGRVRLATVGPGECFGEQALVTGRPRTAAAVAQTGVVLGRLDHTDFVELIAAEPDLWAEIARVLSERLKSATRLRIGLPRGQTVVVWSDDHDIAAEVADALAASCERLLHEPLPIFANGGEDLIASAVQAVRDHALVLVVSAPDVLPALLNGADRVVVVGDKVRVDATRRGPVHALPARPSAEQVDRVARAICGRRVGLALGSGGIRGFAHAGVLAVLAEEGIPLDLVSGASAGAMAGALFLTGMKPRDLADMGRAMRETVKTGMPGFSLSPQAFLSGRRILTYLRNRLGRDTRFEDLPVPFVVATTDLKTREPFHLDHGPLPEAVAAAAAVPGVFPPVTIDGRRLVDGGVSDPVPVAALRDRGADIVIAVNVMAIGKGPMGVYTPRIRIPMPGVLENLFIGFDTIVTQIAVQSCKQADVVIEPGRADARWYEVVPAKTYMKAGETAMRNALGEVRRLLGVPADAS
jgi:NTE family protein